jgi:hypothetical protein
VHLTILTQTGMGGIGFGIIPGLPGTGFPGKRSTVPGGNGMREVPGGLTGGVNGRGGVEPGFGLYPGARVLGSSPPGNGSMVDGDGGTYGGPGVTPGGIGKFEPPGPTGLMLEGFVGGKDGGLVGFVGGKDGGSEVNPVGSE